MAKTKLCLPNFYEIRKLALNYFCISKWHFRFTLLSVINFSQQKLTGDGTFLMHKMILPLRWANQGHEDMLGVTLLLNYRSSLKFHRILLHTTGRSWWQQEMDSRYKSYSVEFYGAAHLEITKNTEYFRVEDITMLILPEISIFISYRRYFCCCLLLSVYDISESLDKYFM